MAITTLQDVGTTGSTEPFGIYGSFKTTAAVTRGYAVSIDSSGTIAHSATATLHLTIGIASETTPSGGTCKVLLIGYCDYAVTDAAVDAPVVDGSGDQTLIAQDGGTMIGRTYTEMNANTVKLGGQTVGKNLAASTGTGKVWVTAGAIGNYGDND